MSRVVTRRKFNVLAMAVATVGLSALSFSASAQTGPSLAFSSSNSDAQARELAQWFRTDKLVGLPDEVLVPFFKNIPTATYTAFLKLSAQIYREAEFWVRRQERLPQGWTEEPFINYIKYRHQPRQVYISWLEGGPEAGAEVIYDETVDRDRIYGHAGGVLGIQPFWLPLNSSLAKISSNHSLRDFGLQYLADRFSLDNDKVQRSGSDGKPVRVEVLPEAGRRLIAVTWDLPTGKPAYYAKKVRLGFDLRKIYVRTLEVWDDNDQLRERMIVDNALARRLADTEFRPSNPEYKF